MTDSHSPTSLPEGPLLVDLYELTMAQMYFDEGIHETRAIFEHQFRSCPDYGTHKAGYCVQAGLDGFLDWMHGWRWGQAEIEAVRSVEHPDGGPLFGAEFLAWLETASLDHVDAWSVPEGRVVHPGVTLTVIEGPLAIVQLLETALLNQLSYETLIATKASLVTESARGRPTLEFGVRRGPQLGAAAGTRAALIGGAAATSYVGAAAELGVRPVGTHAHSMVQAMMALGEGELGAFRAYARTYPDACLLLVDTIDTLDSGLPNAITVFEELRATGHEPVGIRLDSGDLAHLAIRSAQQLDAAGFEDTMIVLSSGLDEMSIWQIMTQIEQEASEYGVDPTHLVSRLAFGVGTKLLTSDGASSLDSVFKLVAIERDGTWAPAVKISESPQKTVTPGNKRVYRLYDQRGLAAVDVMALADEDLDAMTEIVLRHPVRHDVRRSVDRNAVSRIEPLLEHVWEGGARVQRPESVDTLRSRCRADVERLDPGVRRLMNPHVYHVSLTQRLWELKQETVAGASD